MIIGFDLDKIFIQTPPFIPGTIIERLYRAKANGKLVYRIPLRLEQYIRKISHLSIFRPPIQKNIDHVKKLVDQKNHSFFLVSSRFGFLKKETHFIIEKYGLTRIFKDLYFNFNNLQPHEFKDNMIKKLKIDLYVDDDLSTVKYLAKNNRKTFFYWLNTASTKKIEKNIQAITSLDQIIFNI